MPVHEHRLVKVAPDSLIHSVPPVLSEVLQRPDAALAISVSGGKDSQAMLNILVAAHRALGWQARLFASHAHLGRMEWPQTLGHCKRICKQAGVKLVVVHADLLAIMRARQEKLRGDGKPFWPSAAARYCTAQAKREPINKHLRRFALVISAEGIRAEESRARRRKHPLNLRPKITGKAYEGLSPEEAWDKYQAGNAKGRLAFTWYPIFDWREEQVWEACNTSLEDVDRRRELYRVGQHAAALQDWPAHPAYVFGNRRLSCALCVLASRSDLRNGARHNPGLFRELLAMERESGFTFQHGYALEALTTPVHDTAPPPAVNQLPLL